MLNIYVCSGYLNNSYLYKVNYIDFILYFFLFLFFVLYRCVDNILNEINDKNKGRSYDIKLICF